MDSIHNDNREEAILQCFSKRFKQTCSVGFLHLFFIYILCYLKKKYTELISLKISIKIQAQIKYFQAVEQGKC